MPLNEELYCHQQICIPPTFPYLLRQYAKAAIRSQPTDLLKWSTAYFRCLALNVPPPIKPRLEYPIPRDYLGITPGWLKALNYQLQNAKTVNFKVLWDRWMGSCLEHSGLLQILCLGGFDNPEKIPWNKFVGICAGFLNDNLTQTMIMFCEIMTEEPEGGSAMITLEMFLEVYKFLAMIDASQTQILPNLYFTDSFLELEEKVKKEKKKRKKEEESASSESSEHVVEEVVEEESAQVSVKGESSVVSCPDITSDDALREKEPSPEVQEDLDDTNYSLVQQESSENAFDDLRADEADFPVEGEQAIGEEDKLGEEEEARQDVSPSPVKHRHHHHHETRKEERDDDRDDVDDIQLADDVSADVSADVTLREDKPELEEDKIDVVEQEAPEKVEVVEEGKEEEIKEDESFVGVEEDSIDYKELEELEKALKAEYAEMAKEEEEAAKEEVLPEEEEERKIEEVSVPAVQGIGPKVPDELVEAVERYLKRVSAEDHGMTMPRHIRHYTCPPLEVLDYAG